MSERKDKVVEACKAKRLLKETLGISILHSQTATLPGPWPLLGRRTPTWAPNALIGPAGRRAKLDGEGNVEKNQNTHRHGQVTSEEPVLEDTSIRYIDALAFIRNDDHRST
jgi:hypothetical protein